MRKGRGEVGGVDKAGHQTLTRRIDNPTTTHTHTRTHTRENRNILLTADRQDRVVVFGNRFQDRDHVGVGGRSVGHGNAGGHVTAERALFRVRECAIK